MSSKKKQPSLSAGVWDLTKAVAEMTVAVAPHAWRGTKAVGRGTARSYRAATGNRGRRWTVAVLLLVAPWLLSLLVAWVAGDLVRNLVMTAAVLAVAAWSLMLLWKATRSRFLVSVAAALTLTAAVVAALLHSLGGFIYPLLLTAAAIPLVVRLFHRLRPVREYVFHEEESEEDTLKREVMTALFADKTIRSKMTEDRDYLTLPMLDENGRTVMHRDEAAQQSDFEALVAVEPLPRDEDKLNRFRITFESAGHRETEFDGLAEYVLTACRLYSAKRVLNADGIAGTVTIECLRSKPFDHTTEKYDASWLKEHPATSPLHVPWGVKADGSVSCATIQQTLVGGVSRSGKSAPMHCLILQEESWAMQGLVKFFGIDPKARELAPYKRSTMFEAVATGSSPAQQDEALAVMQLLYDELQRRKALMEVSLSEWEPSRDMPLTFLLIDEFPSFADFDNYKKGLFPLLRSILAEGAFAGIYVYVFTQEINADVIGRVQKLALSRIALRLASETQSGVIFGGAAAVAAGAVPHTIPLASKSNGFASSGTAYMEDDNAPGQYPKMRFAFVDRASIFALVNRTLREGELPLGIEEPAAPAPLPELDERGVYVTNF